MSCISFFSSSEFEI